MVRTKENAGLKVGAKAPRKGLSGPSTSAATSTSSKKPRGDDSGGNPVCPRETPVWQKPITDFFRQRPTTDETEGGNNGNADGSSKENVNPEGNCDLASKSSPEGKDDVVKSGLENNPDSSGAVAADSASSSKE